MPKTTHKYTNGEVTVVWKPDVCIHSTLCWKGLREVFDPAKKPWINAGGAGTKEIIEQVRKCPSGALSYFMNDAGSEDRNQVASESAQLLTIEIAANGPLIVKSSCTIQFSDGSSETKTGTTALCRCGGSSKKPYCDGTHSRNGFNG
jgi:uncharacterized Fe-S cluster protein YjdI